MSTFTIKTPEGIKAVEEFLAKNAYLSGGNAPGAEDADLLAEIECENFVPKQDSADFFGWWWTLSPFRAPARELWKACGKPCAKKETKKGGKKAAKKEESDEDEDDDDLDLFGDDPDADAAAAKQKEDRKKAAEEAAKKKPKKAAKSIIVFDIKGFEVGFDWNSYADKVRAIEMDGLTWLDSHQVVDIAFGMQKLRMTIIIVDDKIETDDIWEKIAEDEENVQNVDVHSFDKA